jgi:hypothetical protein
MSARRRPSAALVIACIALVFSITGAATAARTLIKGNEIAKNTITARNLKNGAVTKSKLAADALPARGETGPAGAAGPQGPAGERGATGERGPSEAYRVTGASPIGLVTGAAVTVAQLSVPPGAYTAMATGFVYPSGAAVGTADQIACLLSDTDGKSLGSLPSQVTIDGGYQYNLIGAGETTSGDVRLTCTQIAVGGSDPALTQIGARIVLTRVGSVTVR